MRNLYFQLGTGFRRKTVQTESANQLCVLFANGIMENFVHI